ncbi:NAD(P)/FAD-dependent oxidoreductase [Rhabdaerophilum sp. SD176]|uniref:NAD(P)/FAD-dependent oxidoreductase n=1 Tax=Rhabdaerophilum sp. SD176 TaxID=2983548 RepID=UPI0024DF6FCB|nr:NAD(P)/FAD-dependent oxidoreductase [Rhabdaerophilum sp. SD176]
MSGTLSSAGMAGQRVVIIGGGFGGIAAARALARAPVQVTLIDRRNFHLFQPLLYQVATAGLSPADIGAPIRSILRDQGNVRVALAKVTGIDTGARLVETEEGPVGYDTLIIATGARHAYFGRDEWEALAPGIKTIDDATRLRAKLLFALERAEIVSDPKRRKALLTFVIVGGGPTGVELAGAVAELARHVADRDFRTITPKDIQVLLVEAGPRLLPQFRESMSAAAARALTRMGVEVRTGTAVTEITPDQVVVGGEVIATNNVIWAAGVRASAAGRWLGAEVDRAGRVLVGNDFSVPHHPGIFVIGDTAAYRQADGTMLPGIAPAAKQAGEFVGALVASRFGGRTPRPFEYRDFGQLATVGRNFAVADFGRIRLTGFPGWLLWSVAHVWFLVGFRSRFSVASQWLWSYLTWERGARLITGAEVAMARPPETNAP